MQQKLQLFGSLPLLHLEEQAQLVAAIMLQVVAGVQVLIQVLQATNREMSGHSQTRHGEA